MTTPGDEGIAAAKADARARIKKNFPTKLASSLADAIIGWATLQPEEEQETFVALRDTLDPEWASTAHTVGKFLEAFADAGTTEWRKSKKKEWF